MQENEEIDLGAVFSKINAGIKKSLNRYVTALKKRTALILIVSVLGIASGGVFYLTTKPVFTTEMVLVSGRLSNQYCLYLISNLKKIKNENIQAFAEKLKINTEVAKQIADIKYDKFDKKLREPKDSLALGIPFKIKLYTYDPSIIDTMQTSLINYLENTEFALKRKKADIDLQRNLVEKIQTELVKVDSLKNILVSNIGSKGKTLAGGIVIGDQIDPLTAYKAGIDLYREELNLTYALLMPESITVIEGFIPKTTPDKPVLLANLMMGLLFGFLSGFLVALRLEK